MIGKYGYLALILISSVTVYAAFKLTIRSFPSCSLQAVESKLVEGTPWVFTIRGFACGFEIGTMVDLVAENGNTRETQIIAKGQDLSRAFLTVESRRTIEIKLPNLSDIEIYDRDIQGVNMLITYYPNDAADERAKFYAWTRDKKSDKNKLWYCTNIFPRMDQFNQNLNDESLAYSLYTPHGSRKSYCLREPDQP